MPTTLNPPPTPVIIKPAPSPSGTREEALDEGQGGAFDTSLPFALLERKHPEYDAKYWAVCRALYAGGRTLFGDEKLVEELFPRHAFEAEHVYAERKRRAFYIGYAGEIVDYMVASLFTEPLEMMAEGNTDPFYDEFFEDTSPPMGRRLPLNTLLREQILTALKCKRAWTLVDFPLLDDAEEAAPLTEAEQLEMGALDAYAIPIEPEQVYDWEEDSTGELLWANVCTETARRDSIKSSRDIVTRTYTLYTREAWARYEITFHKDKPPKPEAPVQLQDAGPLSFGKVPLLRLDLPDALWAMAKLEGLAREHFNKRCALSWAEYKSLFQERYEFEAPPDPVMGATPIGDDAERTTNQVHGIGYTQVRYAGDRVEFVGPSSDPFEVALKSLKDLRDEMHRITHQMALTFDNSPSALRRSGESKAQDKASHSVVLRGLGEFLREHATDIVETVSIGRGDDHAWTASGMNKFDLADLSTLIEDAEKLETIEIPSATYQRRHKYMLAKARLADEASEEDLAAIENELEQAYTQDAMQGAGELRALAEEALSLGEEVPAVGNGRARASSNPTRPLT